MLLLTGFSLGCLTLIFIVVARDFREHAVAKVFLALLVAAAAFLLSPHISLRYQWLAGDIMTMLPALFWLLCQLAFSRRPNLFSVWSALALYSFVTPAIGRYFGADTETSGNVYVYMWYFPQFSEYLVLLNGMWVIAANWKNDLIESRRKLRVALLVTLGCTGLWVTISMNTGNSDSFSLPIVASLCSLIVGSLLLKGREGVLLGLRTGPDSLLAEQDSLRERIAGANQEGNCDDSSGDNFVDSCVDSSGDSDDDSEAVQALNQLMADGFYRTEKLTLRALSKQINLPEYKTRLLINGTFNYRNFNDYINQLRIDEAGQRLVQEPDTPIQNIALDVGYRTLSSFNRAFKEIHNQTPTNYRQVNKK